MTPSDTERVRERWDAEPTGPEHIQAIRVLMTCRACEGTGLPFGHFTGPCTSCDGNGAIMATMPLKLVAEALKAALEPAPDA